MKHLCYNDICTVVSALNLLAEQKRELSEILVGESRAYAIHDRNNALRLKNYFSQVGEKLLDIDLDKSVRITATFRRGE